MANQTYIGTDGVENTFYGDAFHIYSDYAGSGALAGGNDTLTGGANGATNYLYGDAAVS